MKTGAAPAGWTKCSSRARRRWTLLLGLVFTGLAGRPCQAQADSAATRAPRTPLTLTLTGGLGGPYGNGLDLGYRLSRRVEATAGGGYDWSGFKAGLGTRVDLVTDHQATTFAGLNLTYSGGRGAVTVQTAKDPRTGQREVARLRFRPCAVARLRAGARWQPTPCFAVLTALGKGVAFGPRPVQYLDPAVPSDAVQAVVRTRRPDGIEVSLAVAVRVGR